MRTPKSVRHATIREHLHQQALGFTVMLCALGGAFAGARTAVVLDVPGTAEAKVPAEAEEPEAEPTHQDIHAHIAEVSARYGVDPRLVAAIIAVESEFHPRAVSRRGAEGLMQLMPETAASYDVRDSFDVRDNIEGGVRHVRRLMVRFRHDIPLVLAAYNAGEQAVIAYRGIPPYRETRRYVVRVLLRYDREAARAVARRLTGRVQARPAFAETTRVLVVTPAVSEPESAGDARVPPAVSVPAFDVVVPWLPAPGREAP